MPHTPSRLGSNGARARLAHKIAMQIGPAERRYVRGMRALAKTVAGAYTKTITPHLPALVASRKQDGGARFDADTLENAMNVLGVRVQVATRNAVTPLFDRMAGEVERQNAKGQALLGIAPKDTGIEPLIAAAREENITLVQKASAEFAAQLRDVLSDPENFGLRVEDLADLIAERGDVSASRAELIARDQTLKLNGKITEERQTSAGVTSYVWSTSLDDRVREEHAALEGQTFSWDAPPEPGHPGEDIQCRCVAIPVVEELDQAFGGEETGDARDVRRDIIKKTSQGYEVVSEKTGKRLTRANLTKGEAEKRLRQIEWFKAHPNFRAG